MKALFANIPERGLGLARFLLPAYPPLGIGYLAAVLERRGWQSAIFDLGLSPEAAFLDRVAAERPDLIGISAVMPLLRPALDLAARLRRASPRSLLAIGGPLTSGFAAELAGEGAYHAVLEGEGEHVIGRLADVAADGPDARGGLADVPGVTSLQDGRLVQCPAGPPVHDLDTLPFPARHLYDRRSLYLRHPALPARRKGTSALTSRGCPFQCSFCYTYPFKERYRLHSADYVLAELVELRTRYGVRFVRFQDDLLTSDRARILRLSEGMSRQVPGMTWHCSTRLDRIDPELLRAMRRAGCTAITFGVESGEKDDLGRIGKSLGADVRQAVEMCHAAGIEAAGHFILGFPWDTAATIRERVDFACGLPLRAASFWQLTPWPGTPIFEQARAAHGEFNDRYIEETDFGRVPATRGPAYSPPGMTRAELERAVRDAMLRFHLRPRILWHLARARLSGG